MMLTRFFVRRCEPSGRRRDYKGGYKKSSRELCFLMLSPLLDRPPLRIEGNSLPLAPPNGWEATSRPIWRALQALGGITSRAAVLDLSTFVRIEQCWSGDATDYTSARQETLDYTVPPIVF